MKKKTNIRTIIRQIVREEVAMAINEVITELKQPTQQVSQPKTKPKNQVIEKKQFVKNSVLNDVLNETAAGDDWKTLGGETQTTENMNSILGNSYSDLMNPSSSPTPLNADAMISSMGENPKGVSDTVKDNIFNKDYSKLVKAMGDKAKQTRGQ
tara:strand:- start:732 stop:1193 length:462 start_codon:yes stop_codon:yes gene_type:complete